ncbi:ISL3 family transposase [Pseudomaricurvus alkylphenolicus]|uniref:ISL3 family transposase n=1 Tax=Pseudomaricurvus alkylphenolicus TaxID=1306991 RepID=UPI0014239349|nr:ISL3 family transposase [Pseudomaricurvus alkylphenolicus]NIB44300.1 ISL3 family transposase [Pseudomaricurvus alkylphenolicus]
MQLKTILNRIQKFNSFVYGTAHWVGDEHNPTLEVEIHPRSNSRGICSGCGKRCPGYDRLAQRLFEFIPFWGIRIFFAYAPRRVNCKRCGIHVEKMPWASGKHQLTDNYAWFLANWAKKLSWKEVAVAFRTTWDHVFKSVEMAVNWGLEHRNMTGISSIGVDEIQWQKGHNYLTLVYQIDEGCRRLLWIGEKRTVRTLLRFFRSFGRERSQELRFICSDMWKPYLKVIAKKANQAVHVFDRYHVVAKMNKAIDEVRAQEAKKMVAEGYDPVLKKSRWALLKRPENLTEFQETKLAELLQYNLKSVRAYLLKEEFQFFWEYWSPAWAGKFLDKWCTKTMRSKIEPMKAIAKTLRKHRPLLLNWFRARGQISTGVVEGFNNKAKLTTRKAYGFKTYHAAEIALYHALGDLPGLKTTHRFF